MSSVNVSCRSYCGHVLATQDELRVVVLDFRNLSIAIVRLQLMLQGTSTYAGFSPPTIFAAWVRTDLRAIRTAPNGSVGFSDYPAASRDSRC